MKGDILQGGSGSQEQPRREIMKGDKLGRQRSSGSQEQPRNEIMKRDKLGRQGGKQQPRVGSGNQEQPRLEIMKGDKLWKQGGSDRPYFPSTLASFRPPPLASSTVGN